MDYPNGHLHHLSTEQAKSLEQFKTLCIENDCYDPSTDKTPEYTTETMLRFLRARLFVPEDALKQFKATEDWRKEQDIDNWYKTIDIEEYEETRLLYTMWTGRRDRNGLPLYIFQISDLDTTKISSPETSSSSHKGLSLKLRRLFATYEHLTTFVMPLCSAIPSQPYPETPISQTTNIVDISGVGLRQFWSLKTHLQEASTLATAHYPETLGKIFIVGAPSFFPMIWNWLKGWFDQNTVSKIFILKESEVRETLERFVQTQDIPKRYGGMLDWQFGDMPNLDAEISNVMRLDAGAVTIPKGPLSWVGGADGTEVEGRAFGTIAGRCRDEIFARMSRSLRMESGSA